MMVGQHVGVDGCLGLGGHPGHVLGGWPHGLGLLVGGHLGVCIGRGLVGLYLSPLTEHAMELRRLLRVDLPVPHHVVVD